MTFISASTERPPPIDPLPRRASRLRLRSVTERGGFVDGGWWPRSFNLGAELPAVIEELFSFGYKVNRVSYHLGSWRAPAKVVVDGQEVLLGGFRSQSRYCLSLMDSTANSEAVTWIKLVVIPPDTEASEAGRALEMAGRDGFRYRPSEILMQAKNGRDAVRK